MIQSCQSRYLSQSEQYLDGMTSVLGRQVQKIQGVTLYFPFAHDCTIAHGEWLVGQVGASKPMKLTDAQYRLLYQDP